MLIVELFPPLAHFVKISGQCETSVIVQGYLIRYGKGANNGSGRHDEGDNEHWVDLQPDHQTPLSERYHHPGGAQGTVGEDPKLIILLLSNLLYKLLLTF